MQVGAHKEPEGIGGAGHNGINVHIAAAVGVAGGRVNADGCYFYAVCLGLCPDARCRSPDDIGRDGSRIVATVSLDIGVGIVEGLRRHSPVVVSVHGDELRGQQHADGIGPVLALDLAPRVGRSVHARVGLVPYECAEVLAGHGAELPVFGGGDIGTRLVAFCQLKVPHIQFCFDTVCVRFVVVKPCHHGRPVGVRVVFCREDNIKMSVLGCQLLFVYTPHAHFLHGIVIQKNVYRTDMPVRPDVRGKHIFLVRAEKTVRVAALEDDVLFLFRRRDHFQFIAPDIFTGSNHRPREQVSSVQVRFKV